MTPHDEQDKDPVLDDLYRFVHQAPVGLLDMRGDGAIRLMNPTAAQVLMPFAVNGVVDNLFDALGAQGAELRTACAAKAGRLGVLVHGFRVHRDGEVTGPAGAPTTLGVTITRAAPDRLFAALSDLSDLVVAERAALAAQARADQASAAKSRYLAGTSHELRQPLTAILGFADVMHQAVFGPLPARYAVYAGHILESARHLHALINDILDLSKIEAGEMVLEPGRVVLSEVVARCRRLTEQHARQAGVTVRDCLPETLDFVADARRVHQVLLNLVSNAIKFTPEGGSVTVAARAEDDGTVVITVSDTGIGIPPEDVALVLEPFGQSTAGRKRRDGTGLGLTIARALTEAHGGTLTLESIVAQGTTVTLRFPVGVIPAERVSPAAG